MGDMVGIDVDAADAVASGWRITTTAWDDVAAATSARSTELLLDAGAVTLPMGDMATGLRLAGELLTSRAQAMRDVRWPATAGWARSGGRAGSGGWARQVDDGGGDEAEDALVEWLSTGPRGSLVRELAEPSAAAWAQMVDGATMVDGGRTMRYFDIARDPGGGVIVVDFFIPDANSLVVDGDGRGHEDPIFGDLGNEDSRMVLVFDLESGRALVQFDDTCLAGGWPCNEARPIEMDGDEIVWSPSTDVGEYAVPGVPLPVNLFEVPNQVSVDAEPGRLEVDYDVLNGIIPIGSVDGTFTLTSDGTGRYAVTDMDTDEYPSIGIYQYRAGEQVEVLAQQDSRGVWATLPWVPAIVDGTLAAAGAVDAAIDATVGAVVDATGAVVDATGAVIEAGTEVVVDSAGAVADGAVWVADGVGDLLGGGPSLAEMLEDYCAAHPEEAACADIVPDD